MKDLIKIGVDTGGTFTDFVFFEGGRITTGKVPSTPENPSKAIILGISQYIQNRGSRLGMIVHGSTVATNALLERKGARIALITTAGFEDVLFIGRQTRRKLFSLTGERREYIMNRHDAFGVNERTDYKGKVIKEIDSGGLNKIIEIIKKRKIRSAAVCLINSYANGRNEAVIKNALDAHGIASSVSSLLLPEYREYERTATTAVNAYLMPVVGEYLADLSEKLRGANLRVMQSNEGYISAKQAEAEPIRMALSGPAGGVVGAFEIAKAAGYKKIMSFDMGGTSTDVSLVNGGIGRTSESEVNGLPIKIPMIDIHTVGAGGGSIAYVDSGGALKVGPESAGAKPGPACYGLGDLPTVTDANLYLGRIDPDYFLGGGMRIYPERSRKTLETLAKKISKTPLETAEGIIRVADSNMEKALRVISIERGIDPRDFHLFSFGGAGGLHAVSLAERLQMAGVIIPRNAGVLSAFGLLLADSIKDYSLSFINTVGSADERVMDAKFKAMEAHGFEDLKHDGFGHEKICMQRSVDMRYKGQSFEINIPCPVTDVKNRMERFAADFQRAHERLYSYRHPNAEIEIVTLRVKAVGRTEKIKIKKEKPTPGASADARIKKQKVIYEGKPLNADVYERDRLGTGNKISGPALVIDKESTTFMPPSCSALVDEYLNIIINRIKR